MSKKYNFSDAHLEFQLSTESWSGSKNDLIRQGSESVAEITRKPWYLDFSCTEHSWKRVAWRILNGVLALLFASAAVFQWNDPDTEVWMIVYLVPCLLSVSVAVWARIQDYPLWTVIAVLHIVGSLGGVIFISVKYGDQISKAAPNITSVEEGWELCGLLVVIFWLIIGAFVASYRSCRDYLLKTITHSVASPRVVFKRSSNYEPERLE